MTVFVYILFPFAMFFLGLITSKVGYYLSLPLTIPLQSLYNQKPAYEDLQSFRIDVAIPAFIHGWLLIFVLNWITNYIEIDIANWYWIVCITIKSGFDELAARNKSLGYKLCHVLTKVLGYIIGMATLVW